jgi:hypothetical protein
METIVCFVSCTVIDVGLLKLQALFGFFSAHKLRSVRGSGSNEQAESPEWQISSTGSEMTTLLRNSDGDP